MNTTLDGDNALMGSVRGYHVAPIPGRLLHGTQVSLREPQRRTLDT